MVLRHLLWIKINHNFNPQQRGKERGKGKGVSPGK